MTSLRLSLVENAIKKETLVFGSKCHIFVFFFEQRFGLVSGSVVTADRHEITKEPDIDLFEKTKTRFKAEEYFHFQCIAIGKS